MAHSMLKRVVMVVEVRWTWKETLMGAAAAFLTPACVAVGALGISGVAARGEAVVPEEGPAVVDV